MLGPGALSR